MTIAAAQRSKPGMVVLPHGASIEDHRQAMTARPDRPSGAVVLDTLDSFIEFLSRHVPVQTADEEAQVPMSPSVIVWADKERSIFRAILNENLPGEFSTEHGHPPAGWRDWKAAYKPIRTAEATRWFDADGTRMDQASFAQLLEDNLPDIVEPTGTTMLDIARTFEASQKMSFNGAVRLDNGDRQINYQSETTATATKGSITVPDKFVIGIPLYEGELADRIECRFRYRVRSGELVVWYEMLRPEKALEAAFDSLCTRVKKALAVPVLRGSPGKIDEVANDYGRRRQRDEARF